MTDQMTTTTAPIWLTTTEAARLAGFHAQTIRRACEDGSLKAAKPRGRRHWRIRFTDLEEWTGAEPVTSHKAAG